ncbi:hypothetical protein [Hymenobacter armeniacus]|uniref:Secreted protein n=1 Tax=Hymenobacter armeniacus TaxID=2771358 RepID=A0ABR8JXE9_9BACT|nr:hypothetical protein [Hymenobacter armeniacus]MBD2723770.1 hypothetical protein [Hymenobacter armeniacus]
MFLTVTFMHLQARYALLCLPLAGAVCSCGGNAMHYDAATRALATCSGATLTTVVVAGVDGKDFYRIAKRPGAAGTDHLRLDQLSESYVVRGWDSRVCPAGVRLRPNTSYRVSNASNGDAAASDVLVKTASDGLITEGSPAACR